MARELSLLERIAAGYGQGRSGSTTQSNLNTLVESVRGNLERVLNARHEMSEAALDYGLPALTDILVTGDQHVQFLKESMQAAVEKYEPRLRRVRVSVPAPEYATLKVVFRIDGSLATDNGEQRVWYEVTLIRSGEFLVRG